MARLYLFDDETARGWAPFSLTRPIGEMLFGCLTLRERQERFWGTRCDGHLAGADLLGFDEPGAPPTLVAGQVEDDGSRIVVSSRLAPAFAEPPELDGPATLRVEEEVVGWILDEGGALPEAGALSAPGRGPAPGRDIELEGELLQHPWTLMTRNSARIAADVPVLFPHSHAFPPARVESLGTEPVTTGEDVELEPGVVLDARPGPIRLEDGVRIRAGTRLAGPAWIGRDTTILGGVVEGVSIGPVCKVHGEVEASVILGYTNKAHDGYLGHAVVGRWVNLGAMTTNSDLKNNYGTVRVRTHRTEEDTGLVKVGCFLGDHVKTGIGTLINTGTVLGAGSNVFGGRMPPNYVPPFSWGSGDDLGEYRIDAFLETAERIMARRDRELTEEARGLLRRAWESSREERSG